MRGIPFEMTAADVIEYFQGHGALSEQDIHIEEFNGRKTGIAAVIFKTPELAVEAQKKYDKRTVKGSKRYAELYNHN